MIKRGFNPPMDCITYVMIAFLVVYRFNVTLSLFILPTVYYRFITIYTRVEIRGALKLNKVQSLWDGFAPCGLLPPK